MTRPPDFAAIVHFRPPEDGGLRNGPPAQGYRCDVQYPDDTAQSWMIWPTFLDPEGKDIPFGQKVPNKAYAHFIIVDAALRDTVHRDRLHIGARFFLLEGSRRVADCTVTELLGLNDRCAT